MSTPHPDQHDPVPTRTGARRPVLIVVGLLAVVAVVALLHLTGVVGGT